MLMNEFVAMRLHKNKMQEVRREAHGNRALDEAMTEIKLEQERRNRKQRRRNNS